VRYEAGKAQSAASSSGGPDRLSPVASNAPQLDPATIEEIAIRLSTVIAERVVQVMKTEGITAQGTAATAWLDARQVAQRLGVSREWVYEHADELGASRIGTGRRPRLRFPPHVLEARAGNRTPAEEASQPAKRRSKPSGLIPIQIS
jgi:predicted DNA-binding transcriptional regulator AlpA